MMVKQICTVRTSHLNAEIDSLYTDCEYCINLSSNYQVNVIYFRYSGKEHHRLCVGLTDFRGLPPVENNCKLISFFGTSIIFMMVKQNLYSTYLT